MLGVFFFFFSFGFRLSCVMWRRRKKDKEETKKEEEEEGERIQRKDARTKSWKIILRNVSNLHYISRTAIHINAFSRCKFGILGLIYFLFSNRILSYHRVGLMKESQEKEEEGEEKEPFLLFFFLVRENAIWCLCRGKFSFSPPPPFPLPPWITEEGKKSLRWCTKALAESDASAASIMRVLARVWTDAHGMGA